MNRARWPSSISRNGFVKRNGRPTACIPFDRVAEEVEEEGLGEGVELGEGGAALGPQRLRPVQHLRNPPLLRQRWQGNWTRILRCSAQRNAAYVMRRDVTSLNIHCSQEVECRNRLVEFCDVESLPEHGCR